MQFFTRIAALAAVAAPFLVNAAPVTAPPSDVIPGKYIVQLKPDADVATIAAHHNKVRSIFERNLARRGNDNASGAPVEREYGFGDFKAYSGSFDEATIEELKAMDEVSHSTPTGSSHHNSNFIHKVMAVEQDYMMKVSALTTQASAPWGLASISSRTAGATSYIYDSSAGTGTFSYVVDTGVRLTHVDFEGRAIFGFNGVSGSTSQADNNGHGTHVAGTVGGAKYGVAKKTTIVAVKVFEGAEGSASDVFSGFDWAVNDIVTKGRQNTAVINMSLGGSASKTWDAAITAAWKKGVLVVVAAGNENTDASTSSPARSPEVICVGNVEQDNKRHGGGGGSNYGAALDIFAAGTQITSASYQSDTGSRILTGTSMASPHVAGLVSYIRGLEGASTAEDAKARVLALGTPGVVTDLQGSVNLLAYNGNNRQAVAGAPANGTVEARGAWKLW
jgi:oryzin